MIDPASEEKARKKQKIDTEKVLFELYEYTIWATNQINRIYMAFPALQNWDWQNQPSPYQHLQYPQQYAPPVYPQETIQETPINQNTPTFQRRERPVMVEDEEPKKPTPKPWYKQKGIIAGIILGLLVIYLCYIFYMKSTGHSVTIPGLGKF